MAHSSEWLKFTAQDFTNISDNPLSDYTHIFQYFSDWIDSIQESTLLDTWRPIRVNGTEQKGSSIGTGYINFGSDTNHNVVFSYSNNTIMANIGLSNYVPTSRKINDKALTSDITLTYSDVGAASSSHTHTISQVAGLASTLTQLGNDIADRVSYDAVQPVAASDQTKIPTIAYVDDMISTATATIVDTKNTTGARPSSSDLFLVGATNQGTNPITYTSSGLKWYGNRAALQIQGSQTGAYYSSSSIVTYLNTATNVTHTFTWPNLSSLGTTAHTIPIQFQYKTATGQGTVSANSKGIVDLTGISFNPIEDVNELPTGSAINPYKFYRITQIGTDVVKSVPGQNGTLSNIVFNTSLSVSQVEDIIYNDDISYAASSMEHQGQTINLKFYDINLNRTNTSFEDISYSIIWLPDFNFSAIVNFSFIRYFKGDTGIGTPDCLWTNNGTVASQLTQGLITFTGWKPTLSTPIYAVDLVYFTNNITDSMVALSNHLLTDLVWCSKYTSFKTITQIYEDGDSSTTHISQLKTQISSLFDNGLDIVSVLPTADAVATSIVAGEVPYLILDMDDTTKVVLALVMQTSSGSPYYLPDTNSTLYTFIKVVNTSSMPYTVQNMFDTATNCLSLLTQVTWGTVTIDTVLKKVISLYHYKMGWNHAGAGSNNLELEILRNHINELEDLIQNTETQLTYSETNDTVIFSLT